MCCRRHGGGAEGDGVVCAVRFQVIELGGLIFWKSSRPFSSTAVEKPSG
jgi:hypothetical protein